MFVVARKSGRSVCCYPQKRMTLASPLTVQGERYPAPLESSWDVSRRDWLEDLALDTRGAAACRADVIDRLDALATELAAHGWTSRLRTPRGRMPSLHARNPVPGAAALSEQIFVQPLATVPGRIGGHGQSQSPRPLIRPRP